jgi:dihydroorotate dehydrogenase
MGFGFLELGTVTPRPQPGNPKPRLFRLAEKEALINRFGFNNVGVDAFLRNIERTRWKGILGINLGKNFDTPAERAADDYETGLEKVYGRASYVTVNISSPNTKGLRSLQEKDALNLLLGRLGQKRRALADQHGKHVPVALKVAPDLDDQAIQDIADAVRRHRFDAVIATNTTVSREGVEGLPHAGEAGGLSGAPVRDKATRVLKLFREKLGGEAALIGAGGILSGADAREKRAAGANLVQLYTGLIYRGPDLVPECVNALR